MQNQGILSSVLGGRSSAELSSHGFSSEYAYMTVTWGHFQLDIKNSSSMASDYSKAHDQAGLTGGLSNVRSRPAGKCVRRRSKIIEFLLPHFEFGLSGLTFPGAHSQ